MSLSRLDNQLIEDPVLRSYLFRVIKEKADSYDTSLVRHYITEDETLRPDLVSYRVYGTKELQWVVTLLSGNEDPGAEMTSGTEIRFPALSWIREQIRHFADDGEVYGTLSED